VLVDLWAKAHKVTITDTERKSVEKRMEELKINPARYLSKITRP
jgi:hypothetical protein